MIPGRAEGERKRWEPNTTQSYNITRSLLRNQKTRIMHTVRTGIIEPRVKTSQIPFLGKEGVRALRKLTGSAPGLGRKKVPDLIIPAGNSNVLARGSIIPVRSVALCPPSYSRERSYG